MGPVPSLRGIVRSSLFEDQCCTGSFQHQCPIKCRARRGSRVMRGWGRDDSPRNGGFLGERRGVSMASMKAGGSEILWVRVGGSILFRPSGRDEFQRAAGAIRDGRRQTAITPKGTQPVFAACLNDAESPRRHRKIGHPSSRYAISEGRGQVPQEAWGRGWYRQRGSSAR